MCKKPIKRCICEDYAWNPIMCACQYDKDCDAGKYLKDCICTSSAENQVVTCDETVDMPETSSINPNEKRNY